MVLRRSGMWFDGKRKFDESHACIYTPKYVEFYFSPNEPSYYKLTKALESLDFIYSELNGMMTPKT